MKNWLIYFLCVAVGVVSVPIASDRMVEESLPMLTVSMENIVTEMDIEEFALRILIAEKPSHPQTIRALAVAARSVGAYLSIFGCKHDEFDICDKGNCCFTLGDPQNCPEELLTKYKNALAETHGITLTIDGMPAMALFCLCAGSATGNCAEFTYLRSVAEEYPCREHIYETTLDYSALNAVCNDIYAIKTNSVLVYEENQKCDFAVIGGKYISGTELSEMLDTKSNEFTVTFGENVINIRSRGIGHGYGMSLCGAEKHAKNGKSYEEILKIYYPDLMLNKIYHN